MWKPNRSPHVALCCIELVLKLEWKQAREVEFTILCYIGKHCGLRGLCCIDFYLWKVLETNGKKMMIVVQPVLYYVTCFFINSKVIWSHYEAFASRRGSELFRVPSEAVFLLFE